MTETKSDRLVDDRGRPRDERLVFLDFETSGLDPEKHVVLEVGAIVASSDLEIMRPSAFDRFAPVPLDPGYPSTFCRYPQYGQTISEIVADSHHVVREMHEASGLIADSLAARHHHGTIEEVEADLIRWLTDAFGFEPRSAIIAGYSVHFDRSFIRRRMPRLDRFLHYRMLDVSAIRECYKRWVDPDFADHWRQLRGNAKHRTLDDLQSALDELRLFRERCFGP